MERPLMPKATALWLIRHTCLTWDQIGQFCQLHPLEISMLAESEILHEQNPVASGQVTQEEIKRCESDPSLFLTLQNQDFFQKKMKKKYVPLSKRAEIPHVVWWVIREYPHISDAKISSFLSTTKPTVKSIRNGTYWNVKNLVPKDPLMLGLCSQEDFNLFVEKSK